MDTDPSSWAGVITAIATVITALGGLVVALGLLVPTLRATRATHQIVNQQRTDMLRYQTALVTALESGGIDVPYDQSRADVAPNVPPGKHTPAE